MNDIEFDLVFVVSTTVAGVEAFHATCSCHPGWRCHKQAHAKLETAQRCAERHQARI